MCSFPTFFTKEWNFEAKKKLNSNSQSPTCTYLVFIPLKSCKDPIKKISLLSNQLYIVELTHHTVLAVLSIRHLPENFPLVIPLLSFRINWLQTEFSVSNFRRWSLNNFVFDKNPSTDHFVIKIFYLLTCKPAPWVSHKKSSEMTYMVTVYFVCKETPLTGRGAVWVTILKKWTNPFHCIAIHFFHFSITQTRCFTILWHSAWWSRPSKIHFLYLANHTVTVLALVPVCLCFHDQYNPVWQFCHSRLCKVWQVL